MFFFLFILCSFASVNALASCKIDLSYLLEKYNVEIDSSAVNIPKRLIEKHLLPEIEKVNNLAIESALQFPQNKFVITIHPNFNFPGSVSSIKTRMDEFHITIPYQHQYDKPTYPKSSKWRIYSTHPIQSKYSFHHELGHALFKYNVTKVNSEASKYIRKEAKLQEMAIEGKKLLAKTKYLSEQDRESIMTPFVYKFETLRTEMFELKKSKLSEYVKGLEELFADLIPVLLSEKADAVILSSPKRPKNMSKMENHFSRDFSNVKNSLGNWQGPDNDVHNIFSPSRYFLYENYLKYPLYMKGKRRSIILPSILKAIHEFSNLPASVFQEMDEYDANRAFIKIVSKYLST